MSATAQVRTFSEGFRNLLQLRQRSRPELDGSAVLSVRVGRQTSLSGRYFLTRMRDGEVRRDAMITADRRIGRNLSLYVYAYWKFISTMYVITHAYLMV